MWISFKMNTNNTHFDDLECTETIQHFERINESDYVAKSDQNMKITDLNQEFIEEIFMYLDLASLVRTADACIKFRKAARLPFKRIYARNIIEVAITPKLSELYDMKDGLVTITSPKIAMSTLRCFGDVITQLKIINPKLHKSNHDDDPLGTFNWLEKMRDILTCANDYCHESLTTFSIDPPYHIEKIRKPFSNVKHVRISYNYEYMRYIGYYPFQRHCLSTIFPRLRCLTLYTPLAIKFITETLPNLQELTINRISWKKEETVLSLQLNPQLRKFSIQFIAYEIKHIRDYVPYLQSIEEFDLTYKPSIPQTTEPLFHRIAEYDMHLQNVRVFKLNLDTTYEGMALPQIPFTMNRLKSFILEGSFLHSESFYDFIKRHPKIISLSLRNKYVSEFVDKFKLMPALPSIEEITILPLDKICMDIHFMIKYLKNFESLNRCTFYCRNTKADIVTYCGTKWNADIIPHHNLLSLIKLTRKN